MDKKKIVRIVCIALAVLMVITTLSTLISMISYSVRASSATSSIYQGITFRELSDKNKEVTYVEKNKSYRLAFNYASENDPIPTIAFPAGSSKKSKLYTQSEFFLPDNNATNTENNWRLNSGATLTLTVKANKNDLGAVIDHTVYVEISSLQCNTQNRQLNIMTKSGVAPAFDIQALFIPESFFTQTKNSSSSSETPQTFTSQTILENYTITDKKGKAIEEITKDTAPFNLTVTFLEYGIDEFDLNSVADRALSVYIDGDTGGFKLDKGATRGELTPLTASSNGIPRFRAEFKNITFDPDLGSTNQLKLKMLYDVSNNSNNNVVLGELSLTVKQAKTKKDDDKKTPVDPLKPYIVIDKYTFGEDTIVAGSEFSLDINYTNTSSTQTLKNILMTVSTDEEYLTIASSSNTNYVVSLAPKSSLAHSIKLKAIPNAKVGSAKVTIKFSYEYEYKLDDTSKKGEITDLTETIAIPITQIDRFAFDPITEIPASSIVGEWFYVPVSFINRGKSTTYNVSAVAKSSKSKIDSKDEHFGNLEPGKSNSLEVAVMANEPGELIGEIVIQYEDDNGLQKELKQPFSIMIEEPYNPSGEEAGNEYPGGMAPPPTAPGALTITFIAAGSLLVVAPIAYYFVKRSKLKLEREEIDEDF